MWEILYIFPDRREKGKREKGKKVLTSIYYCTQLYSVRIQARKLQTRYCASGNKPSPQHEALLVYRSRHYNLVGTVDKERPPGHLT